MSGLLTPKQAAQLRKLAFPYRRRAELGKQWNQRSEDELWLKVLGQIVVVGNARPGYVLGRSREARKQLSVARLQVLSGKARQKHVHRILLAIGTRYVGKNWISDKKSRAAARNFQALMQAGGPRRFFQKCAALRSETERINFLLKGKKLRYYGDKGARDTLIDLGLAKNCMALDARIQGLLGNLGVKGRGLVQRHYEQLERELIQKVAKPMGISGARLDRILFQNYDAILADMRLQQTGHS